MVTNFEKEILEQIDILKNLTPISINKDELSNIKRVVFIASGSSKNAADFGAYFFENIARIPAKVEYASEALGKQVPFFDNDLVIFVSQSGKSKDVLDVLKQLKNTSCKTLGLINNLDSPMAKNVDFIIPMEAGKELAIPASKSFSASYYKLYMLANYFAGKKTESNDFTTTLDKILKSELSDKITQELKADENIVILGHNLDRFAANEIGLKLKESAFVTTISYPLGEFIHGHMAILKNIKTVIAMSFLDDINHKINLENIEKIKQAYNPKTIFITNDNNCDGIHISYSDKYLLPLLMIILFQQVCLKLALIKNIDPDSPEGLNKVVL